MTRFATSARTWIVVVVVVAMVVPTVAFVADELDFRRSADAVVATLEGEVAGAAAAETVLLVRAQGCAGGTSTGTAFVIDGPAGPALVTNRHVVEAARTVGVRALDGATDVKVTGVRLSDHADVAVLSVAEPEDLPPPLALDVGVVDAGDAVRLIGFPAATPFTAAGEVVDADARALLLDVEVAPGASGSPVVAEGGSVVGQVYATTADGHGLATPAARLLAATDHLAPAGGC